MKTKFLPGWSSPLDRSKDKVLSSRTRTFPLLWTLSRLSTQPTKAPPRLPWQCLAGHRDLSKWTASFSMINRELFWPIWISNDVRQAPFNYMLIHLFGELNNIHTHTSEDFTYTFPYLFRDLNYTHLRTQRAEWHFPTFIQTAGFHPPVPALPHLCRVS